MTTATDNQAFVDSLIGDVIQPGVDDLMDSRYFRDLREGKLTTRRMQGFSIQHYIHNMAVLKMAALGATQHASDDRAFMAFGQLLNDEFTHPAMVKRFGLSLGLTEEDFDHAKPVYGPMDLSTKARDRGFTQTDRILAGFTLPQMVRQYDSLYHQLLRAP